MTELLEVLGGTYVNLGLPERAQPLLQRSVALRRSSYGDLSQETADGLIRLANHYHLFRDFEEALPLAGEALTDDEIDLIRSWILAGANP